MASPGVVEERNCHSSLNLRQHLYWAKALNVWTRSYLSFPSTCTYKKKIHNEVQNKICYGTTMDYFGAHGHLISLIGLMQKIMYVTSVIPKDWFLALWL